MMQGFKMLTLDWGCWSWSSQAAEEKLREDSWMSGDNVFKKYAAENKS